MLFYVKEKLRSKSDKVIMVLFSESFDVEKVRCELELYDSNKKATKRGLKSGEKLKPNYSWQESKSQHVSPAVSYLNY